MKTEHKIILATLIIATIFTTLFYIRINDIAQPDEFDKEIAKIKGTEPEPNLEQWIVYLLTIIFFTSMMLVGFVNLYFYKKKHSKE